MRQRNNSNFSATSLTFSTKALGFTKNRSLKISLKHWRRLVKYIGWANQNIGGQNVVKSDKCMGFLNYWGHVPGLPPKSTPMHWKRFVVFQPLQQCSCLNNLFSISKFPHAENVRSFIILAVHELAVEQQLGVQTIKLVGRGASLWLPRVSLLTWIYEGFLKRYNMLIIMGRYLGGTGGRSPSQIGDGERPMHPSPQYFEK